jgi:CHAT domain-containing protein/tetratricopeptide (TPR) repeat protein
VSLTCPSDADILLFALADDSVPNADTARHLNGCASCRERVADLRRLVQGIEASAGTDLADDKACLDEIAMARFVDGVALPSEREAHIIHLAGCGSCRRQAASVIRVLADPGVAAEVRLVEQRRNRWGARRRILGGAGLIAAAALVLVLVRPDRGGHEIDQHRGPTITASAAPMPLSPIGEVSAATSLTWTGVPGAERYRVRLFDASGKSLFETQVADTVMALPDSVVLAPGRLYLWKVEARNGWDRWTPSDLIEFRIGPEAGSKDTLLPSASLHARVAQSLSRDSLRRLAPNLSDSALVLEVQARPLEVRDALTETLASSVHGPPAAREGELTLARRLAAAYAAAWHDEFLVREVDRFTRWPAERRAAKVRADSLRRAGVTAFGRDGAAAAVGIWRRALAQAAAIDDSASMAATLGNIGAGLSRDARSDSAAVYLERSRLLAVALGDVRVEANALSELAGVSENRDDVEGARQSYARAITLRTRIGDSRGVASDYNNLAGLARAAGDLDEARRLLEAALAINRRDGRAEVAATNLVNLAGLASLAGDFAHGEARYRDALATWRERKQWADMADALRGLGELELRRGDYPAARVDLQAALAIYDRTGPVADAFAVRLEMAGALAAEGELQGALNELREARRLADSTGAEAGVQAGIALARADLAAQLNTRQEAERLYASAELLFRRAGDRVGEAEAQEGRGVLLLDQDQAATAEPLLNRALRIELATGNRRAASLTRMVLGDLSARRGDTTGARRQLARAGTELARLGDPIAAADAVGKLAALDAAGGFPAAAESLFRAAIAGVGERMAPDVTWRLHAGLGATLRYRGATEEAARELRGAIAAVEHTGRSLTLAERRSGFLTDKWDVYVQLAMLEHARGRVGAAFEVSERIRANEMLELLAQGRIAVPRDTAMALVVGEQDLRHRIGELTRRMEGTSGGIQPFRGPDVSGGGAVTREALLRAQEAYAELLLEIRERAPRHAALVSRETSTWRDVAHQLPADGAFVEYLVSDASSLAFVITRDTTVALQLGVGRHELASLIDFVRGSLLPRGAPGLDSLWRAPLRQLYRDLVAPIEASDLLAGKTRLVIVPHAELHYLPFAALLDGGEHERFLVERFQLMVTPSASVWLALGARRPGKATNGVLAFAPRPDALPGSRQEVAAIGRLGGENARVVIGRAATEAAFLREAPSSRVIHLATYGVLNKQNPLFSFVALAPDGDADGRLEVHEVFGLRLAADLVVLSACQTGLGSGALTDVPAGDDWVGLARAFLSAGTARVMATLWPVQDRASAALMERFYQGYVPGSDPNQALAAAQRALLSIPATASPYYWAGFELIGGY